MTSSRGRIAYEFVLDELAPLSPRVRPMFGAHGVYVGAKFVMMLREKERDRDDGVWIAARVEHHDSLRRELPSMRSIYLFEAEKPTSWQVLPADGPSFEREVVHACSLILRNDPRIGSVPREKKPRPAKNKGAAKNKVAARSKEKAATKRAR